MKRRVPTTSLGPKRRALLLVVLLVSSVVTPFVGVVAASGGVTIDVRDASGSSVSDAEVVLYDSDWNVEESGWTGRYGQVTFSGYDSGEYRYEVYDEDGVFWGGGTVTVSDGITTDEQFRRTEPYRSDLRVTDRTDGDGTHYVGDTVNVAPQVRNAGSYGRNVRVEILLDTDGDGNAEISETRGPLTIDGDSTAWYGYDYEPETSGTKRVRVKVRTDIGGYAFTDDTGWTESFEVRSTDGSVRGRVTDSSGDPITGAKVYLDNRNDVRTDNEGRYTFSEVSPGQHSVYVTSGSCYETRETTVSVDSGETARRDFRLSATRYEVDLDSEPASVSLDGAGTYDCGADVPVSAPERADGYEFAAWETPNGETVSSDRSFTLDYLTSDTSLVARYQRAGAPDLTVEEIDVSPSAPRSGETVSFDVTVANVGSVRADDVDLELSIDGASYRRENLDLGAGDETTVAFTDAWAASSDATVRAEVDPADRVDEAAERNNDATDSITVGSAVGAVRGRVTGPDGEGVEDVTVSLDGTTDTRTDADGRFSFTGVPVGSHDLDVATRERGSATATVEVSADETATRNLLLEAPTRTRTVTVEIPDAGGNVTVDPPGETLRESGPRTLTFEVGETVTVTANANPGYEFANWTGDYPEDQRTSRSVTLTAEENLTLRPQFRPVESGENRISWATPPPEEIRPGEPFDATVSGYAEAEGRFCLKAYPNRGSRVDIPMEERCREVSKGAFELTFEFSSPKEAITFDERNYAIERFNNVTFAGDLGVESGFLGEEVALSERSLQVTRRPVTPSSFPYEETVAVSLPSATGEFRDWKWMQVRVDREELPEPDAYRVSITVENVGREPGGYSYFEDLDGTPNSQVLVMTNESTASVSRVKSNVNGQTRFAETREEFGLITSRLQVVSDVASGGLKFAAREMIKRLMKDHAKGVVMDFLRENTPLWNEPRLNVPAEWQNERSGEEVRVLRADFERSDDANGLFPGDISEIESYTLTLDVTATDPSGSTLVVVPDMRGKFVHQDSGAGGSPRYRYATEYRRQISVPIPAPEADETTTAARTATPTETTAAPTETPTTVETTAPRTETATPEPATDDGTPEDSGDSESVIETVGSAVDSTVETVSSTVDSASEAVEDWL